ncbi:MAG TPA: DUF2207 domain-containing protein [Gaiellaceae bacterium]|nr:DUF2207 domain-containing protein [Gaiellaceae bacterium]
MQAPASRWLSLRFFVCCLAAAAFASLALPGAAYADSFSLISADVAVDVQPDGSLGVSERLEVAFSGDFHFGYRDIPLRDGETLLLPSVAERGVAYAQGTNTELAPGAPRTFGVVRRGDGIRIVWYFQARDQTRAFTISYTLQGVAVAYDDVVDVNLQVWGDQWAEPLGRLVGIETAPGSVLKAWGKPVWVRGDVELTGRRATLRAVGVPAHQFVELRTLIPRAAFTSTFGMKVVRGNALDRIVEEERADAEAYGQDREKIDRLKAQPLLIAVGGLALATIPALLVIATVYVLFGRERRTSYDREYEQEPPADTEPALVPTLLRQGGEAGSYEFTATLFDLIRRGVYKTEQTTTERSIWGGLRSETVSDLDLSAGTTQDLRPWERDVADVVDHVLDGSTERLSRFRDRIEDERESMHPRFTSFKEAVGKEVGRRRWFWSIGAVPLIVAAVLFGLAGGVLVFLAQDGWRSVYPRYSDVLLVGAAICLLGNAALAVAATIFGRRIWRRRAPMAQLEAERWEAFRRYLSDFPRLQEAPPATLALWERYLVYGIAFGIAERVLQGAQLHMPEAIHDASSIYWITPGSDLGSGPSSLSIGDLASGFGSALAPPNSGAGGGGGGFSGGGGGGGGFG